MYLGDPREQQICPDEHTIWEENNRVEKRYQWGAMVIDLCDLDPNEYAQTIFHVSGNTGGGGDEKVTNELIVNFTDENVTVNMDYSPTSELFIVVNDSEGGKMVIDIQAGSSRTVTVPLSGVIAEKISDLFIGFSEESATSKSCKDDNYKYVVREGTTPVPPTESTCLYGYFKHIDDLTEQLIIASSQTVNVINKECNFNYDIQPVSVEGFNDMTSEEYNRVISEEEVDLYIFTSEMIDKIFLNDTEEQTSSWQTNYTTMTIDGKTYNVTRFVQPGLVNIYDPNYEQPSQLIFDYKITTV